MMRRPMVSLFTDVVTVHAGDVHVQIQPGQVVDFDMPVGVSTLEQALGPLTTRFEAPRAERPAVKERPAGREAKE